MDLALPLEMVALFDAPEAKLNMEERMLSIL